ncbi:MAG: DUF1801 domain-containing protein [Bacteroidota bacterium]
MAKNDNKTVANVDSVANFMATVEDPQKAADSQVILDMMKEITQEEPVMWGKSIVGFGSYHYKYASGREGDWMLTGFSPRKTSLTLYLLYGLEKFQHLLDKLGKHKTGKGCLYIKRLSDVDQDVLKEVIAANYNWMKETNGGQNT